MRTTTRSLQRLAAMIAWLVAMSTAAGAASAAMVTLGADADTYIRDDSETRGTLEFIDVRGFAGADFVGYVRFDLSGLNILTVNSATLSLHKIAGSRNDAITNDRHEVQGLLNMPGNSPQDWIEAGPGALNTLTVGDEYNPAAPNSVDLGRVLDLDPERGANVTEVVSNDAGVPTTLSGPDLVGFLNDRVADGGLATFILSINADNDRGYGFASREHSDSSLHPTLTLEFTVIPEPASCALLALGGLALAAPRRRHKSYRP